MIDFSIIIPLYNKEKTIRKTIESVLEQGYPFFELIIVDDESHDQSVEIVQSIKNEHIHLYHKINGGPSSARNFGIKKASKNWVLFLDADDILLPNSLIGFSDIISKHPGIEFFTANFFCTQGTKRWLYASSYPEGVVNNAYKDWFFRQLMPRAGACVMSLRIAYEYPFKEYLRRSEDTDVLFDIMRNNTIYRIETPVMEYSLDDVIESKIRRGINKDFQGHLSFDYWKSPWEKICLYELYVEAKNMYPDEVDSVYPDLDKRYILKLAYHLAFWYRYLRRLIK